MVNLQMHASVSSLPCYRSLQQSADECNAAAWSFICNMTACRGLCCQVIVGMANRSCFLEKTELGILRLARRLGKRSCSEENGDRTRVQWAGHGSPAPAPEGLLQR